MQICTALDLDPVVRAMSTQMVYRLPNGTDLKKAFEEPDLTETYVTKMWKNIVVQNMTDQGVRVRAFCVSA